MFCNNFELLEMKVSMELTENPNESSRYAKQIMMETLDSTIPVILSPLRW